MAKFQHKQKICYALLLTGLLLFACVAKPPQKSTAKSAIKSTDKYYQPTASENDTATVDKWMSIKVLTDISVVGGRKSKGNVKVRFESTNPRTSPEDLEEYAIGQLKRKAAAIDGEYIFITYKNVIILYGEMPTIEMLADVY
jgi:hypothetical protein